MKSLDQLRAAHVWKRLEDSRVNDDYVNLTKGAPALIMSNGLMQTLAFLKSKDKEHHKRLLGDISSWLADENSGVGMCNSNFNSIMNWLHNSKSEEFMRATEETLEYLRWLRQYASAVKNGG